MHRFLTLLKVLVALLIVWIGFGCATSHNEPPTSPVGLWNAHGSTTTLTLTGDGQARLSQQGATIVGRYSALDDAAQLKLEFEFESGKRTAMYAVISGKTLSFVNLQGKRVRFSKSDAP